MQVRTSQKNHHVNKRLVCFYLFLTKADFCQVWLTAKFNGFDRKDKEKVNNTIKKKNDRDCFHAGMNITKKSPCQQETRLFLLDFDQGGFASSLVNSKIQYS